ncbi:MAG: ORF6N domain-containing protein [Deltaproteobacteria bacterium]|nr:ORF6N domain-containing protein [Deltaproteobacteria bacterium]MBW2020541.1 ORF6N domain-containing protein [Deltaproteobacteria bacterium]MBW2073956.1 ORF6N domain-containing protein [Deltaproteobacteria bacterium]RLB82201.1 MAG: hypothetical protein DRH17_06640 [Deltaproteobacteria bacterium]
MFQLTADEAERLRCQIGISKTGRGGRRYLPYAFTEQGVAMLSSVLNSLQAIQVNIAIMRAFVKLRHVVSTHKELAVKLSELERKIEKHDERRPFASSFRHQRSQDASLIEFETAILI